MVNLIAIVDELLLFLARSTQTLLVMITVTAVALIVSILVFSMMQLSAERETTLSWRVVGPFTELFLVVDV